MSTKGTRWVLAVAAGLVAAGLLSSALAAEEKKSSEPSTAADLKIDLTLKALRMPVLQPMLVLPQGKGAPAWPLYKEQPPAAQKDFRPPPPEPEPEPVRVREREREDEDDEKEQPKPTPPPQPPPQPCTPNHPNWPNC
jgi:outer membrane biosynthesis protein TonB